MKRTLAILAVLFTPILGFARGASSSGGDPVVCLAFFVVIIVIGVISAVLRKPSSYPAPPSLPAQPQQSEPVKRGRRPDEQRHFYIYVRGVQYTNRQAAIQHCVCGEQVRLVREPSNSYDQCAILIRRSNGQELGYVPHETSIKLAPELDSGRNVRAEVDWISQPDSEQRRGSNGRFGAKYGFGIKIRIGLLKVSPHNKPPTLTISVSAPQAGGTDKDS